LIFFNLTDPKSPNLLGCAGEDGYAHDVSFWKALQSYKTDNHQVECLVYRGPHTKYLGRDICYSYNEDTLTM
jgi:hypothetical protein